MENTRTKGSLLKRLLCFAMLICALAALMAVERPISQAATAGSYYVEITYTVTSPNNFNGTYGGRAKEVNDSAGITLTYKSNNGTGTESVKNWDLGNNTTDDVLKMKTKGTRTISATVSGFPTEVYAYLDDNYFLSSAKMQITTITVAATSSSTKTTLWTGTMQVASSTNPYAASIALGGVSKKDYFNSDSDTYVNTTTNNWNAPAPSSISWSNTAKTGTVPLTSTSTVKTNSATVKDQYGVEWYQEPQYAINTTNTAVTTSASVTGLTMSSGNTDIGTLTIANAAKTWVGANKTSTRDIYINAYINSVKSTTLKVTLTNCQYTVTYVPGGGDLTPTTQNVYYNLDAPLPAATFEGWNFLGWNTSATATTALSSKTVTAATTLYAIYNRTQTLVYDAAGGSGEPAPQELTQGYNSSTSTEKANTFTVSSTTPTRLGYTFAGWSYTQGGTDNIQPGSTIELSAATTTLYAKWTVNSYTITKSVNGSATTSTQNYGTTVVLADAALAGYRFDGWTWTKTADGSSISAPTTMPEYNVTATAVFTKLTFKLGYDNLFDAAAWANATAPADSDDSLSYNASTDTITFVTGGTNSTNATRLTNNSLHIAAEAHKEYIISYEMTNNAAEQNTLMYVIAWDANGNALSITDDSYIDYGTAGNGAVGKYDIYFNGNHQITPGIWAYDQKHVYSGLWAEEVGVVPGSGNFGATHVLFTTPANTAYVTVAFGCVGANVTSQLRNVRLMRYDAASTAVNGVTYLSTYKDYTATSGNFGALATASKTGYAFGGWYTGKNGAGTQVTASTSVSSYLDKYLTVYPKWTANTYTVNYDGNGATSGSTAASTHTYDEAKALTSNGFSKTGYTFAGWATTAGGAVVYTNGQSVTNLATSGSVTLYAKWTANTYTVNYNGNGSTSGSTAASTHTYDAAKALTPNGFSKTGYTFAGWATTAGGNVAYTDGQSVTNLAASGSVTLYAKWTANAYTIIFNKNDSSATGTMDNLAMTYDAAKNLTANAFTKTGYTFAGWSTMAGGSVAYANGASVNNLATSGNVNLYAKWTANSYSIKFNANNGTGTMADLAMTYGTAKNLTANVFTRTGYTFAGWATTAGGTVAYADGASVNSLATTGTFNLYAKWTPITYTLAYNANTGTGTTAGCTVTYDTLVAASANGFSKTGYGFTAWNTKADGTGTSYAEGTTLPNLTSTAGATVTLYAQWSANSYTIAFDGNGSTSGSTASVGATYDANATLTANGFSKTGYSFNGWNTAANGSGTAYADSAAVKNLTTTAGATVTLYAQWKVNSYVLTKSVSGATTTENLNYGAAISLANAAKTGYTFTGWTWTKTADGSSIATAPTTMPAYGITATANFTANTYSVKFNANTGTGTMGNQSFTYDAAQNLTANVFTKTGYTFAGWATAADGNVAYGDSQSVTNLAASGTVELFAKWTANGYTIAFDGNNATSGSTASVSATYDADATLTDNGFARTGYSFNGWNTAANGSGTAYADKATVSNLAASGTKTLYAQWTANTYIIVYDKNTGAGTMASTNATYDAAATLTANAFTKAGYRFIQWNTKADGTGTSYADSAAVTNLAASGSVTLYAQWAKDTYDVTYTAVTGIDTAHCTPLVATGDTTLTATVYAATGYHLNSGITVKVSGSTLSSGYTYTLAADKLTATLTVDASAVVGNVNVTGTAAAHVYTDHYAGTNGSSSHTAYCSCGAYITESCTGGTATCTEAKTCDKCATIYGEALGHNYVAAVTAPTCTAAGFTTHTCSRCSDSYTDTPVAATGHSYGAWSCNNDGTHSRVCANDESHVETAACADSAVTDPAVAATCTATGLTQGSHCSACNYVITARTVTPVLGHSFTNYVYNDDATCTADGTETAKCDRCAVTDTRTKTGSALGHDFERDTVRDVAATCTATGKEAYSCSRCDATNDRTIAATGHTVVVDAAVAPTCTATGLTEGSHCSVCDAILTAQETVAALGHDYVAAVTAPTCTAKGYTTYTCSRCDDTYTDDEVAALGHTWNDGEVTTAPTCTTAGVKTFTCTICSATRTEEIAATGHTVVTDEAVAPTCTATGLTEGSHCSVCDAILTAQEEVAALGHDYVAAVTAPTCTAKGYTTYTCSRCNDSYVDDETAALGHTWNDGEITTAPTCTTAGVKTFTCTVCDATKTEEIAATGHTVVVDAAVAPTCTATGLTEGSHCSVCDAILTAQETVAALGHNYVAAVTDPTCTAKGYTTYTCSRCDDTYTDDEVAALGHTWNDGEITTAPTCTTAGVKTFTCTVCDETKTEEIAATGHTVVVDAAVAPTCTATGLTEGSHCSVCDAILTAQTTVAALGHNYVAAVTDPTCTAKGYTTYTCSRCDDTYTDDEVAATGHTWNDGEITTAPTCTTAGVKTFTCTICSATRTEEIAATGHTVVVDAAVAPTCTATGLTEGSHCSVCDAILTAQETVAALGHNYVATVTAPTCTAKGYTTYTCSRCNDSYVDDETAALGHTWNDGEITTAPTCTTAGVKTFTCTVCDATKTEEIAATGHTVVVDAAVAPTCTATGLTEGSHCSVCDAILTAQEEVAALGHNYVAVVTDPTCTAKGYTTYTCSRCDDTYTDDETAALGHTWNDGEITTAPTCTTAGVKTFTCTICDETKTEEIAATGHTVVVDAAVAPTCTATGLTEGSHCSVCDAILTAQTTVAALGHNYVAVVTDPTCTAKGYTTYTCSRCDDTYTDDEVAALGHTWNDGEITTAPTCTTAGVKTFTCTVCDETKTEEIAATGHTVVVDAAVAPTCTATGLTEGSHCSVCDAILTAQETVAALGHNYVAAVTDPTCTADGYTTYTCSRCDDTYTDDETAALGHTWNDGEITTAPTCTTAGVKTFTCTICDETKTEEIAATGHTVVVDAAVAPTCTATGLTEGSHCSVCDAILTAQETVAALGHDYVAAVTAPTCTAKGYTTYTCSRCDDTYTDDETAALGHTWNDGEVTTAPTCTTAGVKTFTCTICDETKTEEIAATGHTVVTDEAVAPTCTATGLTEGSHCSVCDAILTAQETVAALGHDYVAAVTAPTCTAKGYTTYTCSRCDDTYTDDEVAATGHTWNDGEITTAPTCTEAGVKTFTCTICDATKTEEIAATGHTVVVDAAVAPTCTATGLTEGSHCSVCDAILTAQETVAALGHNYVAAVTDPTCTAKGYTTYTCSRCDNSYTADETAALGHTWNDGEVTIAPTCTTAGVKTFTCTICDETKTEEIAATGHTEVVDAAVAPTCTATGLTEGSHCSVCDAILTAQETVAALGHNYVAAVTAPTCTAKGYTTYACSRCDDTYTDDETAALGHTWNDGEVTTAPTCTTAGVKTFTCTICDATKTEEIAATGHTVVVDAAVAPTCTATGLTEGSHCSVCDAILTAQTTVAALGHNYVAVVTDPTCTAKGYTTYTCSRCDDTYTDDEVAATGHTWNDGEITTAPTCTTAGVKTFTCTICDATKTEEIAATGHTVVVDAAVAPTCTATGLTEGSHCSVCDAILTAQETVAALGHTWDDGVVTTEPTCSAEGVKTFTCTVCSATETAAIAALEHTYAKVVTPATCTAGGYTTYACAVCSHNYTTDETAALGHDYVAVVTAPTCEADGYTTHTCSRCSDAYVDSTAPSLGGHDYERFVSVMATCTEPGVMTYTCKHDSSHTYDEVILPLGHAAEKIAAVAPTCTKTGLSEGSRCSRCGITLVEQQTVPAAGHTPADMVAVAPTCTQTGMDGGVYCTVCGDTITAPRLVPALGHDLITVTGNSADGTCAWNSVVCSRHDHVESSVVTIIVHDNEDKPVAGTQVKVNGGGITEQSALTNADGTTTFEIKGGAGTYTLAIADAPYDASISIDNDGNMSFNRNYKPVDCPCICHSDGIWGILCRLFYKIINTLFGNNYKCCTDMVPYSGKISSIS